MKRIVLIPALSFAIAACGGEDLEPMSPIDDPYVALFAVPDRLTLLGPGHGRTIAVFGIKEDGTIEAASPTAATTSDRLAVHDLRVRGLAEGSGTVIYSQGTKEIALPVEVKSYPPPFASELLEQTRGAGDGYGRDRLPDIILGPPKGVGPNQGSLDTLSLGVGGSVTLGFVGLYLYDGPGDDFIVFENAFSIAGNGETFAEPAIVEVKDAESGAWRAHACDTEHDWPYAGCAGVEPVLAGPARPELDPTDPIGAGGDRFDLAEHLIDALEVDALRITDARTGTTTGGNSGFDLDAVALIHTLPIGARALEAAPETPRTFAAGILVAVPRFDVEDEAGAKISGVAVRLEPGEGLELDAAAQTMRAMKAGAVELTARAGHLLTTITFDITLTEPQK